jgi:uracil-DNA glycosylase
MSEKQLTELFGESWYNALKGYLDISYFMKLGKFIKDERSLKTVYPDNSLIFKAFKTTPFNSVKVVMLGQDPYVKQGQACGLAFAIEDSCMTVPYSLKIIQQEIEESFYDGLQLDFDYTLNSWAKQGVLLLNTALTVIEGIPESHLKEWSPFTKTVLRALQDKGDVVFLLLGKKSQAYKEYIARYHPIIEGPHPAVSAYNSEITLIGSKVFNKVNEQLTALNLKEIVW